MEIRERDHYLCQWCLKRKNKLTHERLSVHHIVPIEEDEALSFEDENLITLCDVDHEEAEKGNIEREVLKEIAKANIPPGF